VLLLTGCATTSDAKTQTMFTTWYMHGKKTANGERFDPNGMTAAHRTLPFGTRLLLTYKDKSVIVRINDRGPFVKGRQLDLARGAAKALGCLGNCMLKAEILK
jgi:rare lipoprotein A